jgi:hypothetical protein
MTDEELYFIIDAIKKISVHHLEWVNDYVYNKHTNEFKHKNELHHKDELVRSWFELEDKT